eukprot:COSAG01_NODE_13_length_41723_cov_145.394556_54_plen_66_part_00
MSAVDGCTHPALPPTQRGGAWRLDAAHTAAAPDAHDDRVVGGASASAAELSSSIISASSAQRSKS